MGIGGLFAALMSVALLFGCGEKAADIAPDTSPNVGHNISTILGPDAADFIAWVKESGGEVRDNGKSLSPIRTYVTDLSSLATLTNLTVLDLSGTVPINVSPLAAMKGLTSLNLIGTLVTDQEVAKLEEALPNCKIRH